MPASDRSAIHSRTTSGSMWRSWRGPLQTDDMARCPWSSHQSRRRAYCRICAGLVVCDLLPLKSIVESIRLSVRDRGSRCVVWVSAFCWL
jgi:hypothetical protein